MKPDERYAIVPKRVIIGSTPRDLAVFVVVALNARTVNGTVKASVTRDEIAALTRLPGYEVTESLKRLEANGFIKSGPRRQGRARLREPARPEASEPFAQIGHAHAIALVRAHVPRSGTNRSWNALAVYARVLLDQPDTEGWRKIDRLGLSKSAAANGLARLCEVHEGTQVDRTPGRAISVKLFDRALFSEHPNEKPGAISFSDRSQFSEHPIDDTGPDFQTTPGAIFTRHRALFSDVSSRGSSVTGGGSSRLAAGPSERSLLERSPRAAPAAPTPKANHDDTAATGRLLDVDPTPPRCGTEDGYKDHRRYDRGQQCERCKTAHAEYERQARTRRRNQRPPDDSPNPLRLIS